MNIVVNGEPRETADRTTVADLLKQLDLEPRQVAVEVNFEVVPREKHAQHVLQENDQLEVVSLAGGG